MSDYTSGNITFMGLGNGTDFSSLIDGMIKLERTTINRMELWKSSWQEKTESLQDLNTKLLSLKSTMQNMDTIAEFEVKDAESTNTNILTASADADAQEGTNSILVSQLATNEIWVNTAYGESDTTNQVTSSDTSIGISYMGTSYSVSIPSGTTLEGLVNRINNDADLRDKVRASTIYDGSSYHLQLHGMDLGSDAQITIDSSGLPNYQPSDFDETQAASNAKIKVNGYPMASDAYIERKTNTISDVIDGLTLSLKETSSTAVRVAVETDNEAIKENVRTFVSQINMVRQAIIDMTKFDELEEQGSVLTGNYGVEILIGQRLKDAVADQAMGFQYYDASTGEGDLYSSLAQVGILTDAETGSATRGLLTLDEEALDEALDTDPDAVSKLFSANYLGESESGDMTYLSYIDGTTQAGVYDVEYQVKADGTGLEWATINGNTALISNNWEITGASGKPEEGIAIRADTRTASANVSGTVTLKLGKCPEIEEVLDQLTSDSDGPIHILEENYENIMDNIDKKIDREEDRITRMERRLKNQYARLDATLGRYEQINQQLSSSISQLSK